MGFYQTLVAQTQAEQNSLLATPIIEACFKGDITLDDYVAFLGQAYHHVKHTVPLLMAVGAKLPEDKEWLREAVGEYIDEEMGHQEWILNDISSCGFDKEVQRRLKPLIQTELMVAYAYDTIERINPLGFFGMVHVLEGTSINLADKIADAIRHKLGLPKTAFTYLYSHGSLDLQHVQFFEALMNKITDEKEQKIIIHSCKVFYQLYGNIFRSLNSNHGLPYLPKKV